MLFLNIGRILKNKTLREMFFAQGFIGKEAKSDLSISVVEFCHRPQSLRNFGVVFIGAESPLPIA